MSFEFFRSVLPSQGFICIGLLNPQGGFRHRFFENEHAEKAYQYAMNMDAQGEVVFFAQAGFETQDSRKATNTVAFKALWLDIDCGDGKPFDTQEDAAKELKIFVERNDIPHPAIVNSGNGLYAYWLFSDDLTPQVWHATASILKGLCISCGFAVDPVRTCDKSSVLRPTGSYNRKNGNEKLVKLEIDADPIDIKDFATKLILAAKKRKVPVRSFDPPKTQINAEFQLEMSGEKPSAHRIAEKCAQIGHVKERRGDVSEPLWYAAIGLLRGTIEAPEIIHEWSCGHPEYSRENTDKKIEQHKVNATTCAHFHSIAPERCLGCPQHSKINSPWRLGLEPPKPVELPEEVAKTNALLEMPQRFMRTNKGIVYNDRDSVVLNVFPYDIFPTKLSQDETLGQEIMTLRAKDPHAGWFDVQLRTALMHDPKALLMALADQGIHPYYGKAERMLFMQLLAGYMQQLKDNRRKVILSQQMGWHEENNGRFSFVLGDRLISDRGIEDVGVAKCADGVVRAISKVGNLEEWTEATRILDKPGLEPWAFTLAAVGFGAPLMKFTGYRGSLVSLVGSSGIGKTCMAWWSLSVWGNPDKLQMIQRDSHNATIARMSLYNNLPLYIDELTNTDQKVLSDLCYEVTQGRDKLTLTRARSEREALPWATIGCTSTNKSLVDILGGFKPDPSAEVNRIFEFEFPKANEFNGLTGYKVAMNHFGNAGEVYAQYLVEHQAEHADNLSRIMDQVSKMAECMPEERYWAVTAACALYGGSIANKLGLFHVDMKRLARWVFDAIRRMRGIKTDVVVESPDWLGSFLSRHSANTLVVRAIDKTGKSGMYEVLVAPRGPLYVRRDVTSNRLWIGRDLLRRELTDGSVGYNKVRKELEDKKALLSAKSKMVLGKGTEFSSIGEMTWEIDLGAPALGAVVARLVVPMKNEPKEADG